MVKNCTESILIRIQVSRLKTMLPIVKRNFLIMKDIALARVF